MTIDLPQKLWFRVKVARSSAADSISRLLQGELLAADCGLLDEPALYIRLCKLGFKPAWVRCDGSVALSLRDPVAGTVVLKCETTAVTLH